jgi:hypothetical protein
MATVKAPSGGTIPANTTPAKPSAVTAILGIGLEMGMLGIATLVAASSDDVGGIIIVFMAGLLLLFLFHHTAITNAIPNLFAMLPATATS